MTDTFSVAERSRIMAAVKSKGTTPEMVVRRLIHAMGFRYRLHLRLLPGAPDMVFPSRSRVVFVHGCYWHMHTCGRCRIPAANRRYWIRKLFANTERDKKNIRKLRQKGWRVLVIWECQTLAGKLDRLRARIERFFTPHALGSSR